MDSFVGAIIGAVIAVLVLVFGQKFNWRKQTHEFEEEAQKIEEESHEDMELVLEMKEKADEIGSKVDKVKKRTEARRKRNKLFVLVLVLLLTVSSSYAVVADDEPTYEELVQKYEKALEQSLYWKSQYKEVENELSIMITAYDELDELFTAQSELVEEQNVRVNRLLQLVDAQQSVLDKAVGSSSSGFILGASVVPLHPDYSGIIAGLNVGW